MRYYRSVNKERMKRDQLTSSNEIEGGDNKDEKPPSSECSDVVDTCDSPEVVEPYRSALQWSPSETDQIFVSHCEEDLGLARDLVSMMESRGLSCFLPERDAPLGPEIQTKEDAIRLSRRVLILLTRQYMQTRFCRFELQMSVWIMYESQRALIVPVLVDIQETEVLPCLKNLSHVDKLRDPNYEEKLISILKDREIQVADLMPIGNVSHGLAWAYYLRYLKFILPDLKQRIENWCLDRGKCVDVRMPRKLYILVPASCHCPEILECKDGRIKFCDKLEPLIRNSAGSVDRSYGLSVWNLDQKHGETLQFVAEYAAIIDTLALMEQQRNAGLSSQLKLQQRAHFVQILDNMLRDSGLNLMAELVIFDEKDKEGNVKSLSEILAPCIEKDRL
ncbi:hypothetical protein ACOMHN_019006 [Nucella lapillus]